MNRRDILKGLLAAPAAMIACNPKPHPVVTPTIATGSATPAATGTLVPPSTPMPTVTPQPTPFVYPCGPLVPFDFGAPLPSDVKFGKKAPIIVPRTVGPPPNFPALPNPPDAISFASLVRRWPVYGNDQYGDCTCAAAGHMIEIWQSTIQSCLLPSQDDIVNSYFSITGGRDEGAVMLDVLNYWKTNGFDGDRILDWSQVSPTNMLHVKQAIQNLRGLYIGFAVDSDTIDAFNQGRVWDIGHQFTGEGHAVNIVGYDASGVTLVTWGHLQKATWGWFHRSVDEAWAVLPVEAQSGLFGDINRLQEALQLVAN